MAGLPLGRAGRSRLAQAGDGPGHRLWSAFTAANAFAWSFGSFLAARIGVGIGEASYAGGQLA